MSISSTSTWIQNWHPKPQARLRLFCFPYAGGGASIFRDFSTLLPSEVEVWPIQLPGRENRLAERALSDINELINALQQALLPYLDVPYALFGHSMGALVSFELTRSLRRTGCTPGPRHLFVSGRSAPQIRDVSSPIHHLPEPEFIEELRHLKGTPEEVLKQLELLELLLPLLRADFALCENYVYAHKSPLTCPISAFGGLQDGQVPCQAMMGWREQTIHSFKLRFFEGDHFFLRKEQASLLQALSQDILDDLQEL